MLHIPILFALITQHSTGWERERFGGCQTKFSLLVLSPESLGQDHNLS